MTARTAAGWAVLALSLLALAADAPELALWLACTVGVTALLSLLCPSRERRDAARRNRRWQAHR